LVAAANALVNSVNQAFGTTFTLPQDKATIKLYEDAITELTWAIMGEGEQYARASVGIGILKPWLRQGMWVTVNTGHRTLTGYTDAAQHSIRVSPTGTVTGSTTLTLCRITSSPDKPEYRSSIMTASLNPEGTPVSPDLTVVGGSSEQRAGDQATQMSTVDIAQLLPETQLTKDFKAKEFASKPDATLPPQEYWNNLFLLAEQLQKFKDKIGGKYIVVISGYRTKEHNSKVGKKGGAKRSQHLLAKAADIKVVGMTTREVRDTLRQMMKDKEIIAGGLCEYPEGKGSFVHYDIRGKYETWVPE
jgi:hypothetical protein